MAYRQRFCLSSASLRMAQYHLSLGVNSWKCLTAVALRFVGFFWKEVEGLPMRLQTASVNRLAHRRMSLSVATSLSRSQEEAQLSECNSSPSRLRFMPCKCCGTVRNARHISPLALRRRDIHRRQACPVQIAHASRMRSANTTKRNARFLAMLARGLYARTARGRRAQHAAGAELDCFLLFLARGAAGFLAQLNFRGPRSLAGPIRSVQRPYRQTST